MPTPWPFGQVTAVLVTSCLQSRPCPTTSQRRRPAGPWGTRWKWAPLTRAILARGLLRRCATPNQLETLLDLTRIRDRSHVAPPQLAFRHASPAIVPPSRCIPSLYPILLFPSLPPQIIKTTGGEAGTLCVRYATLEEAEGVPLVEWQPVTCIRPAPPPLAEGSFPPEHFNVGDLLQLWYNDGWWECEITDPPEMSKRQAKDLKKKQATISTAHPTTRPTPHHAPRPPRTSARSPPLCGC